MNIAGLDKAKVLAALYNGARQQGLGFLNQRGAAGMTEEEAREELKETEYFDYLHNRDNGAGAAERIIEGLRSNAAG